MFEQQKGPLVRQHQTGQIQKFTIKGDKNATKSGNQEFFKTHGTH